MGIRMLDGARYRRTLTPQETGSDESRGHVFERYGSQLTVAWTEDETPSEEGTRADWNSQNRALDSRLPR